MYACPHASVVSLLCPWMGFAVTGRWILRWSPVCIFNESKIMHAGLLVCFVFYVLLCLCAYFKREKNGRKTRRQIKKERERRRERGNAARGQHHITFSTWCSIQNIGLTFHSGKHGAIMPCIETCCCHVSIYQWTIRNASAARTDPEMSNNSRTMS